MIIICNYKKEIRAVFDSLHWRGISRLRQDIEYYLIELFSIPAKQAQWVSIAVHELLQNTIQYGGSPVSFNENEEFIENKVELLISIKPEKIGLVLINSSNNQKAEKLIKLLENMRLYSPKDYYLKEIRKNDVRGGLGLARIYFECNALIYALYNTLHKTLHIKADFPAG